MASGGRFKKNSYEVTGNAELSEYSCTLCAEEGRNVEAINFCVECEYHFCTKCVQYHHRLGKMKKHQILDRTGMKKWKTKQALSRPTEKCPLHPGNILDTFCREHDAVCCDTCVSSFHKSCVGTEYVPSAAVGIQKSEEFEDVKTNIQNIKLQLKKMKKTRQDELLQLETDKHSILNEIKDFRKRVEKQLDFLEKATTEEIKVKHHTVQTQIHADIKSLDEMMKCIKISKKKLEKSTGDNASNVFVNVKSGKKSEADGRKLLHKMEQNALKFRINPNIENLLNTLTSLGDFQSPEKVYTALPYGEFDMKVSDDKYTCDISGTCQLANGTVLVVDCGNNRVKRLDRSYQVKDYCDLSSEPYSVCATGPQEVAVTSAVEKEVQLITVGEKMVKAGLISLHGDYERVFGVSYTNKKLFVSCFPGALRVYNMSGQLLNTIQMDSVGQKIFSDPRHVTLSRCHTRIHIADWDNGLITLGIHGGKQAQFTDPELKSSYGVCVGDNDMIFVCGYHSHNVVQIGHDRHKLGVVLETEHGIKNPTSLYWDMDNSRLIVTLEITNQIKVFDIHVK